MSQTNNGQRVNAPTAINGDAPVEAESDEQRLKEEMKKASEGTDNKLHNVERHADEDSQAVRPEHRQNDAGQ